MVTQISKNHGSFYNVIFGVPNVTWQPIESSPMHGNEKVSQVQLK